MKLPPRLLAALIIACPCLAGRALAQTPDATKDAATKPAAASATSENSADDPIARIRDEGLNRSQVAATLSYLTDVIGPRLTGSPGLRRANEWTRDQFSSWGLTNARLEPWGPFGRGWSLRRFSAQVIEPQTILLIAYPKAWSPGVGPEPLVADVVHTDIKKAEDFARFRGKLRGKVVLDGPLQELKLGFEPLASRRNEENLLGLANAGEGAADSLRASAANPMGTPEQRAAIAFLPRRYQFFAEEGVAVLLQPSRLGGAGTLFTAVATVYPPRTSATDAIPADGPATKSPATPATQPNRGISPWKTDCPPITPQVTVAAEHYNRLVRILRTLELKPRRTIRVALWSGEEQGLLGSKAYVAEHFGSAKPGSPAGPVPGGEPDPLAIPRGAATKIEKKAGHGRLSAYFNLDNGTGKIRGIYLQNNEAARPIFRQWLKPFRDLGAETVSLASTGSTDHISFDAVGLPGFQFIQDPIEYRTRTHHANMDVYDRALVDDLKQASVIMAAFVDQAAMHHEKIPRKPAPVSAGATPAGKKGKTAPNRNE